MNTCETNLRRLHTAGIKVWRRNPRLGGRLWLFSVFFLLLVIRGLDFLNTGEKERRRISLSQHGGVVKPKRTVLTGGHLRRLARRLAARVALALPGDRALSRWRRRCDPPIPRWRWDARQAGWCNRSYACAGGNLEKYLCKCVGAKSSSQAVDNICYIFGILVNTLTTNAKSYTLHL